MDTTGILSNTWWTTLLIFILRINFILSQDNQNFYFGQSRFVPSFQNHRNGFFSPASGPPFHSLGDVGPTAQDTSPSFVSFSPYQSTRSPDYFDLSPRPFGIPISGPGPSTFSRIPQSLRSSSSGSNTSFLPSSLKSSSRINVPHDQNQFLARFTEQSHLPSASGPSSAAATIPERATAAVQSNRIGRPFGSGSPTGFSRNRQVGGFNRQNPTEPDSFTQQQQQPQQQLPPYRSRGNRFYQSNLQPTVTPSTTTSTTTTTTEKVSRYNRFGSGRSPSRTSSSSLSSPSSSSASSATGGTAPATLLASGITRSKLNKTLFQPRRPVFISREVNEPIHARNRPISSSSSKITINHNGGNNQAYNKDDEDNNSKKEEEEPTAIEQDINNETNHVIDEKPVIENTRDDISIETYEKLSLHEDEKHPKQQQQQQKDKKINITQQPEKAFNLSQETINDNDQTVILTSNFFLPDGRLVSQSAEEIAELSIEGGEQISQEDSVSTTHRPTTDYEYEYEDYEERATSNPTTEPVSKSVPVEGNKTVVSTTEADEIQMTTERESQDEITDRSASSPDAEQTTIDRNFSNQEMNSREYDEEEEYEDGVEELSGEYEEDEGPQQKPANIVGKAVVSVVTTKSVINGSTAYPQQVTPSSTSSAEIQSSSENESEKTEEIEKEFERKEKIDEKKESDNGKVNEEEKQKIDASDEKIEENKSSKNQTLRQEKSKTNQDEEVVNNTTEGYVVVASIQTSRSISGARFLPFPAIEQEEKKQTLSELERKIHEKKKASTASDRDVDDKEKSVSKEPLPSSSSPAPTTTTTTTEEAVTTTTTESSSSEATTEKSSNQPISTESIIDKLDRVQSELSSGVLAGKFPILNEMPVFLDISSTPATSTTSGSKYNPINIRKFIPKSTTTVKPKVDIETIPMDDLSGLLPPGFKPRSNTYRNRKITTTTTTTTESPKLEASGPAHKSTRNSTGIGRSFKNSLLAAQEISLSSLLSKGHRANNTATVESSTTETPQKNLSDLFSKIKFEDNLDKLIPKDYKDKHTKSSTKKPSAVTVVDDISKFLPPGYKMTTTTTKKPTVIPLKDDINKLLPPGYKPSASEETTKKPPVSVIPLQDDLSKLLPPGFKLDVKPEPVDISKLLPKDFKPTENKEGDNTTVDSLLNKIEFKDVSSFLPAGFKQISTTESAPSSTAAPDSGLKVVFPKGLHKRPGVRLTTPKTLSAEGPTSPPIIIKKGPPTRATTEFTGWPTPSTTPISIDKLLEMQRAEKIDISDLLPSSTTTTTTTTTTTSTEPPRPTEPGLCRSECDLAGTIKIVEGVQWKPELLDHNTVEWKNLAREIEAQLNEVYSKSPYLSKWFKKVRIDSFNKGSVLVDYFVELANITREVDTVEIKQLFHDALLSASPVTTTIKSTTAQSDFYDYNDEAFSYSEKGSSSSNSNSRSSGGEIGEKLVKETLLLGRFVVDPVSTDFIVIPKTISPIVEYAEEDVLLPQWAIVVIVIGAGSLCFIVVFGVTVLINRQNRAKKVPTPLTNDMLNELNKNHMGGVDNYGAEDFYNVEDTWDTKQPIKPKRFTNSMNGSNTSNIYDSWRSNRYGDYYYDSHNYTPHKMDPYATDIYSDAHQMYTYNNSRSSRYHRDYDPDF